MIHAGPGTVGETRWSRCGVCPEKAMTWEGKQTVWDRSDPRLSVMGEEESQKNKAKECREDVLPAPEG